MNFEQKEEERYPYHIEGIPAGTSDQELYSALKRRVFTMAEITMSPVATGGVLVTTTEEIKEG